MKLPLPVFAVVLWASLACQAEGSGDDDLAGTQTAETETTTAGETTAETTAETETGGPMDFPPVECGATTCGEGVLCVEPSPWCDYNANPVAWVYPDPVCKAFPSECADLQDYALLVCLWETVCEAKGQEDQAGLTNFELGLVDCPFEQPDCFE